MRENPVGDNSRGQLLIVFGVLALLGGVAAAGIWYSSELSSGGSGTGTTGAKSYAMSTGSAHGPRAGAASDDLGESTSRRTMVGSPPPPALPNEEGVDALLPRGDKGSRGGPPATGGGGGFQGGMGGRARGSAPVAGAPSIGGAPGGGLEDGRDVSGGNGGGQKKEAEAKAPPTFHANAQPPSVARVYLGDGNSLELVSLQVSVVIEGPRARTFVDHIFHNPHDRRLEGTFEYPLPSGASPSYFAMFLGEARNALPPRFAAGSKAGALPPDVVAALSPEEQTHHISTADWGTLREARVVGKKKALETYEEITRQRIDPALLEYAAGNTFRGRVFPINPRGYNRVVLAYEELLPTQGSETFYRFALPGCDLGDMDFFLLADCATCKNATFLPKDTPCQQGERRLAYHRTWKSERPHGEAVFRFTPVHPESEVLSGQHNGNGPQYLYARLRPQFGKVQQSKPFAEHAVFLLDSSLSEHPDRFALNVRLMKQVLESDPDLKQFNILTFSAGSAWVSPKGWLPNTPEGRKAALDRLDGLVLEGATDLSGALDRLASLSFAKPGTPLDLFVLSDGNLTWGETDTSGLVARFEARSQFPTRFHCYRTGLGAENLELYAALTRKGGGVFNCFTEADLAAAAKAHRAHCLQVERVAFAGGPPASDVLVAGRKAALYPEGELLVAARFPQTGKTKAIVEGTLAGEKVRWEYPLEITGSDELAPRGWAEIAVSSLLALNDPKHEDLVTAYCQEFGLAGPTASFLVLETDNDYKRFKLDEERGKLVAGDLGRFVEEAWNGFGKVVGGREAVARFLADVAPRVHLFDGAEGAHVKQLLTLLSDKDCELPEAPLDGTLLHTIDVPPEYLMARNADPRSPDPYLMEAQRRAGRGDLVGAVRVLSTVVEQNAGRDDARRFVGYRLLDMNQAAHAVRLFAQVQKQRPFEPHSYRDLARSLEESGKYGLAALQYEAILAGEWHNRFHQSFKEVAQEEYVRMMRQAIQEHALTTDLANLFGERLETMRARATSDLCVTISWNTDNTDIDLYLIEPDGSKCYYQNRRTPHGGELSEDCTQGYGPERYRIAKAWPGEYKVLVHYCRANPNLLAGETHVNVVIARFAGTPQEVVERKTVVLRKQGDMLEVCKLKLCLSWVGVPILTQFVRIGIPTHEAALTRRRTETASPAPRATAACRTRTPRTPRRSARGRPLRYRTSPPVSADSDPQRPVNAGRAPGGLSCGAPPAWPGRSA